jgi:hypothetical protein
MMESLASPIALANHMHALLTSDVHEIVRILFPPAQHAEVATLVAAQFASPDAARYFRKDVERCCLAALKLSGGDLGVLRRFFASGYDWREMLMAAGFGDPTAHESWFREVRTANSKGA